jgi:GNAT superfamily N-acetyltransferase
MPAVAYEISTDRSRIDLDRVHRFLSIEAYWSMGVTRDVVERSIANSICFGVYAPDGQQVGFARAVTDKATFAWIADVYIEEEHRGDGLGKRLVESVLGHPELKGLRRWFLATADAHELYRRYGFNELSDFKRFMARSDRPREQ